MKVSELREEIKCRLTPDSDGVYRIDGVLLSKAKKPELMAAYAKLIEAVTEPEAVKPPKARTSRRCRPMLNPNIYKGTKAPGKPKAEPSQTVIERFEFKRTLTNAELLKNTQFQDACRRVGVDCKKRNVPKALNGQGKWGKHLAIVNGLRKLTGLPPLSKAAA